ncbi:hypothetical protein RJZ56_008095, partial [Blastomyces dermatitidis]
MCSLSGGELQRVAIAGVILKNSKIVLLDKATSSLDSEIEVSPGRKPLSLTNSSFYRHRLSTVMDADQILVVKDGRILERGTHSELQRILL